MSLVFNIGANIASLQTALGRADSAIKGFATKAESSLVGVGKRVATGLGGLLKVSAVAAGAAIAAAPALAAAGMKAAMDAGGDLEDLATNTGESIRELMALRLALDDAGVGAEQAQGLIGRLHKALTGVNEDGEPTNATFARLGLTLRDFEGKGAVAQLDLIASRIRNIKDPAERTAAAMGIFGKSGGALLTLFADGDALGKASQTLGRQAQLMEEGASTFAAVTDHLNYAGIKLQGFFVGMASQVAPVLLPILEGLNSLDFAAWGEQIGNAVAIVIQAFASGQIRDLFGLSLKIGAKEGADFLFRTLRGIFYGVGQYLGEVIIQAIDGFSLVTQPEFWTGLLNVLAGASTKFAAWMVEALGEPIIAFQAGLQYVMEVLRNGLITAFNGPIAFLRAGIDLIMQELINGLLKIPGMKKLLGMEEVNKTFEELLADAKQNSLFADSEKTDPDIKRIHADLKADGATLFGLNSKDLHALADAELAKGSADLAPILEERFKSLKESLGRIKESFLEGFSGPGIFDASGEIEAFTSIIDGLAAQVASAKEKTLPAAEDSPFSVAATKLNGGDDKNKRDGIQVISSALTRVGGGGYSGAAGLLDRERNGYLKRIVANTTPKSEPQGLKIGKLQTGGTFQ